MYLFMKIQYVLAEAHNDAKVVITKDNTDSLGHWLVIHNPNELDDVNVTILVAKGKG